MQLVLPGVAGVQVGVGDGQTDVQRIDGLLWESTHRLTDQKSIKNAFDYISISIMLYMHNLHRVS